MKFNNLSKISSNILISRITGLFRDILFANFLGASLLSDAFMFAFRLPNLFRRILAEGAINSVFIPLYLDQNNQSKKDSSTFFSMIFILLLFITSILSGFVFFQTEAVISLLAPGFISNKDLLFNSAYLLKITFPFLIFVSVSALLSSVLNANNNFFIPSFLSVILNISMIITLFIYKDHSHIQLAWSILLSGFIQLLLLLINFKILKITFNFTFQLSKSLVKALNLFFIRILQSIVGAGIVQLNIFISMIFASLVGGGAISQMYYADRIIDLPFALIAVAISTTLLPYLSKNTNDIKKCSEAFNKSIIFCLIFAAPSTVGILLISEEIISVLFGRGKFDSSDISITASLLTIYAFSLPAYMVSRMLNQIFYSFQKVYLPIIASIPTFIINLLICFFVYKKYGVLGLAFSSVVSVWFNVIFQLLILKFKIPSFYHNIKIFNYKKIFKIFIALIALSISLFLISKIQIINPYFDLFLKLTIGCSIYFIVLRIVCLDEIKILFSKYSFN
jgi:putative peptidoglycan lipid II flippase|tara:strand:+ start:2279 stop:3799 length:1521 start_codon:yes stop_codon:yes gene_type:complete